MRDRIPSSALTRFNLETILQLLPPHPPLPDEAFLTPLLVTPQLTNFFISDNLFQGLLIKKLVMVDINDLAAIDVNRWKFR